MSWANVLSKFKTKLTTLGFVESIEKFDFSYVPDIKTNKSFIILASSLSNPDKVGDVNIYYPRLIGIEILIAYKTNPQSSLAAYDGVPTDWETISKHFENPTNFPTGAIEVHFKNASMKQMGNSESMYIVSSIQFEILYRQS